MKWMKKIGIFLILLVINVALIVTITNKINQKSQIKKILGNDYYSYLPKEAKDYIEQIYEETGNVVLTEKNKQENTPYLNPQYISYLQLSESKKRKTELVPEPFILDFNFSEEYSTNDLPSYFDLRNVNGKNYLTPLKDQGELGICWAFSSIENAETALMYSNNQSYNNQSDIFSARQLDYATSNDGILKYDSYIWNNSANSSRRLAGSGNFFTSSIAMANGLSLVSENDFPYNTSNKVKYANEIFDYNKSLYEVDGTVVLPIINVDSVSQDIVDNYTDYVKYYILEYGGPFVGTYSPDSTCGFINKDGKHVIKTDDCVSNNTDKGHAMQIIGWDDNYEYQYCDAGTTHYSVSNGSCSSGTLTSGKGAWILRNSWGDDQEYSYLYLTFDSTRVSISFITALSSMKNRSWDNNYHTNPWINGDMANGVATTNSQTLEFNTHNSKSEKIEKIKFLATTMEGTYKLSIISSDQTYQDILTAEIEDVGIYTFNLSDKNVIIPTSKFSVKIEGLDDAEFVNDSISVFTSNINDTPYIETYSNISSDDLLFDYTKPLSFENPLYIDGGNYWALNISSYYKNIPLNGELSYRFRYNDQTAFENRLGTARKILYNDLTTLTINGSVYSYNNDFSTNEAYGQTWILDILYGDKVVNSFPVKFNGKDKNTTSTIKIFANNGTDNYLEHRLNDGSTVSVKDYITKYEYDKFYNNGHYITGWNTEPDGSGISYSLDDVIYLNHDINIYAQWSDELLSATVYFDCNEENDCDNISGQIASRTYGYNDAIEIPNNTYVNNGYIFSKWEVNVDVFKSTIYEQENDKLNSMNYTAVNQYLIHPIFNNPEIHFYAVWLNNYVSVNFDANGGTGSMDAIKIAPNTANRLKYNLFTRQGYEFKEWNTKSDGTGTSYTDADIINIDQDITLYAQWDEGEPFTVKNYRYDQNNKYIDKIDIYTTVEDYSKNIELGNNYTMEVDYKLIDDKIVLYTGAKTYIYKNGELFLELTNIVPGDTNGDGKINYLDYVKVYNHIQKVKHPETSKKLLENEYLMAADISGDDRINYLDYVKIYKKIKELKGGTN